MVYTWPWAHFVTSEWHISEKGAGGACRHSKECVWALFGPELREITGVFVKPGTEMTRLRYVRWPGAIILSRWLYYPMGNPLRNGKMSGYIGC